jgi:hypothetical protein
MLGSRKRCGPVGAGGQVGTEWRATSGWIVEANLDGASPAVIATGQNEPGAVGP